MLHFATRRGTATTPPPPPPSPKPTPPQPKPLLAVAAATATAAALLLGPPAPPAEAFAPPWCRDPLGVVAPPLLPSELPASRPPDWPYCTEASCAASARLDKLPGGALVASVEHRPLRGVTPEALRWWFEGGVEGTMAHPLDGKVYARYLVWHPRDHVSQTTLLRGGRGAGSGASGGGEGSGSGASGGGEGSSVDGAWWLLKEFFLGGVGGERGGWVASDGAGDGGCAWAGECYTKAALRVEALDDSGLRLGFALPWRPDRPLVSLTHDWRPSPEGLVVTSTLAVGIVPSGGGADGDGGGDGGGGGGAARGWADRLLNAAALRAFGGADAERCLLAWRRHCVEEFGDFPFFLPGLYEAETGGSGEGLRPRPPFPGGGGGVGGVGVGADSSDGGKGGGDMGNV